MSGLGEQNIFAPVCEKFDNHSLIPTRDSARFLFQMKSNKLPTVNRAFPKTIRGTWFIRAHARGKNSPCLKLS